MQDNIIRVNIKLSDLLTCFHYMLNLSRMYFRLICNRALQQERGLRSGINTIKHHTLFKESNNPPPPQKKKKKKKKDCHDCVLRLSSTVLGTLYINGD